MFWAIVMITLPQVFGWFAFWGVGSPLPGGGIGNGWMAAFANDAVIFVNTFVIERLVPVLAAWLVLRSVIDFSEGYTPLASILGAMFLLAIPATAALLKGWNDGTRFGTASVIEGAWTYTASRIMPIAAGLAVIGAIINFAFGRPASCSAVACANDGHGGLCLKTAARESTSESRVTHPECHYNRISTARQLPPDGGGACVALARPCGMLSVDRAFSARPYFASRKDSPEKNSLTTVCSLSPRRYPSSTA